MNIDKKTIIGFILMALVMFGFMFYDNMNRKDRAAAIKE